MSGWGDQTSLRRASRARRALRGGFAVGATLLLSAAIAGCRTYNNYAETIGNDTAWVDRVMAQVDVGAPPETIEGPFVAPLTLESFEAGGEPQYWDMTLDEAICFAMANSKVLRDLGGTILSSPQTLLTQYTRGLQQTDPRFGMEGALSQFDAQLHALAQFQHNDRVFNNRFLGGGTNFFRQDREDYVTEISKLTATGARMAVRNITDYDDNNAPGNLFGSAWQTQLEGELRQPLLQGGGVTFNRIAGPNAIPGVSNGVLIAKVNTDMTSTEFNTSLRNYLSDVINAYWDLYFAYRDLDSKQQALEKARETWQSYEAEARADRRGGVSEALAREQFYRFQADLEDAIAGRVAQRTQARNGATGGAFRGVNGVQACERRLRLLIGVQVNDQRLVRAVDDPQVTPIVFDWESMASEAVNRRPELQRQRLLVKRRDLELVAARNFLMPRLDLYGTYRIRGLGHDLAGDEVNQGLRSAWGEVGTAEHREWQAGVEFSMPFGFRQGHAAVQNAELQLARERAILHEQERQVMHDLSTQVAEVDRAYRQVQSNLNRYLAAKDAVDALEANREVGLPVNLEQVLDAQRRFTDAQTAYHMSRSEYAIALKNVHLEKGSLFEYSNVMVVDNTPVGVSDGTTSAGKAQVLPAAHSDAKESAATGSDGKAKSSTEGDSGGRARVDLLGGTDAPATALAAEAPAAAPPVQVAVIEDHIDGAAASVFTNGTANVVPPAEWAAPAIDRVPLAPVDMEAPSGRASIEPAVKPTPLPASAATPTPPPATANSPGELSPLDFNPFRRKADFTPLSPEDGVNARVFTPASALNGMRGMAPLPPTSATPASSATTPTPSPASAPTSQSGSLFETATASGLLN